MNVSCMNNVFVHSIKFEQIHACTTEDIFETILTRSLNSFVKIDKYIVKYKIGLDMDFI